MKTFHAWELLLLALAVFAGGCGQTGPGVAITTDSLPSAQVASPYAATLQVAGGTEPYRWTLRKGTLPEGLSLNPSSGALAGAPASIGNFPITLAVEDSSTPPIAAARSFVFKVATIQVQITTPALPSGAMSTAYSVGLTAANGVAPYTWALAGGKLPPGLSLDPSGQISGTPSQSGNFSVSLQVKDSSDSKAKANFSVNIAAESTPVVNSIMPSSSPTSGGSTVTITGANFIPGASVSFGGTAASSVTVASPSQIVAVTPSHIAGTVGVMVREDGQSSPSVASFTYNALTPTVATISPNNGPTAGGTSVTISGMNFLAGAMLLFGTVPATNVTVVSATQIQAVTPANAAGLANVAVENPGNLSANLASGFTYNASQTGPPTISGVSPTSGAPGTQITITGSNFNSADVVSFGSINATPTTFVSATQMLASVPSVSAGTYNVTVTDPDPASVTLNNGFIVMAAPPAQSLLAGCTVNSSNNPNCSTPSGWTLVLAEGFDSGSLASSNEYVLNSAGTTPNLSTTRPHTGTRSSACNINYDGEQCALGIVPGTIGSSNHIYVSFWRYMDPNACNNTEIYFADTYTGDRSQFFDVMDTQGAPGSCTSKAASQMLGDGNFPFNDGANGHSGNYSLSLGTWEQVEFEFKGSTCTGNTPNKDGLYRLFINGQLNVQNTAANLEGCGDSSVGMAIEAGGAFTYLASDGHTNVAPGNGAFNVYIDDVIVLKQ